MGVSVTSRPDKEISSGRTSRWLAVNGGYPVFFTFYRKDYSLSSVQDDGNGLTELRIASNITSELTAGHTVFFSSAAMGDFSATITNFSYNGTHTLIQTDEVFTAGSTDTDAANYLNLLGGRPDYRLYIQVWGTETNEKLFEGAYSPAASGKLEFDVSGALTPHLNLDLNTTFPAISQTNTNGTEPFYLAFAEYYGGVLYNYAGDLYVNRAVNCANQLLDSYDFNLGDRVAFNYDITPKAKWLTAFESPRYWVGYPFKLSTIFEAEGADPTISREEEKFDAAGASTGTDSTNLASGHDWTVIHEVGTGIDSMASTVCEVDVWLESDLSSSPCTQLGTLTQPQKWSFQNPVTVTDTSGVTTISVIYIQRNPISGLSSIDNTPNMTVSDGTNTETYAYNATQGGWVASTGSITVVPGGTYTFDIATINVTFYGTSCTTSFSQAWVNGTAGGGAYSSGYSSGYDI